MEIKPEKSLRKSIITGIVLFILLLSIVLSFFQYNRNKNMMYDQYERYISNIITYADSEIDDDDLENCIKTGKESKKFRDLQSFLDQMKDNMRFHFLYVIIPLNTNKKDNIQNVIAAVSKDEYKNLKDSLMHLNDLTGESYSPEVAKKYLDAYKKNKLSFFENKTEFGDDYTGLMPLYDSKGKKYAALCVDVDIKTIHGEIMKNTAGNIIIVLLLGTLFALLFGIWTRKKISQPIHDLEECVVAFAEKSHAQKDPDALLLDVPDIHTGNEIESLSKAVEKMSVDMRDYVSDILSTEKELAHMNTMAMRDPLTRVGNMNLYIQHENKLNLEIKNSIKEFAVVMADVNGLKNINDSFGHEKGDTYLKKCCRVICEIFRHSPVFRVGGDEFVVLLEDGDYENRSSLMQEIRDVIEETGTKEDLQPWDKVSFATGIAEFDPDSDKTVGEVRERADRRMYIAKEKMKK